MSLEELREKVASWLRRLGFSVRELPVPQTPPTSWLLEASTSGVRIRVAGLPGLNIVAMSMGVSFQESI